MEVIHLQDAIYNLRYDLVEELIHDYDIEKVRIDGQDVLSWMLSLLLYKGLDETDLVNYCPKVISHNCLSRIKDALTSEKIIPISRYLLIPGTIIPEDVEITVTSLDYASFHHVDVLVPKILIQVGRYVGILS